MFASSSNPWCSVQLFYSTNNFFYSLRCAILIICSNSKLMIIFKWILIGIFSFLNFKNFYLTCTTSIMQQLIGFTSLNFVYKQLFINDKIWFWIKLPFVLINMLFKSHRCFMGCMFMFANLAYLVLFNTNVIRFLSLELIENVWTFF